MSAGGRTGFVILLLAAVQSPAALSAYLARSYEMINDEREKRRRIIERCPGAGP